MRVLVTGPSGFLGRHVCTRLNLAGYGVRALTTASGPVPGAEVVRYEDADRNAPSAALRDVDAVIHLAARVHIPARGARVDAAFLRANAEVSERLAIAAANAGVREFLFASSVKAAAESSPVPLRESDRPAPADAYGASKLEAERRIAAIAAARGMNTASLRLPLMYGAGMRANMLALFKLVDRGLPLPLGGIENRRSLLYAGNAAAAFAGLLGRLRGQEVFYAADGIPVSTPELLEHIAAALGRRLRLLPAPTRLLALAARMQIPLVGGLALRLAGSLAVDHSRLLAALGAPLPYSFDEGLARTAGWYREVVANS
jgi:nucleoside-diphosphate-sugar epimerase